MFSSGAYLIWVNFCCDLLLVILLGMGLLEVEAGARPVLEVEIV